jgi:hypothetical protein
MVTSAVVALLLLVAGLSFAFLLTVRAYEGERLKAKEADEQRARADRAYKLERESFHQARQAVKLFEEISEEELAGKPPLQLLRRRLLAAALKYYQDFINQRGDDLSIRAELEASHDRIKTILNELATLTGAHKYLLLRQEPVQEELHLTPEQRHELARMGGAWQKTLHDFCHQDVEERERLDPLALARKQETQVAALLKTEQLHRFKQLALQALGPAAFSETEVTEALGLTAGQKKRIRALQDQVAFPAKKGGKGGGYRGPPGDARKRVQQQILDEVLKPEQKQRWEELVGARFHGEFHPDPMRFLFPGSPDRPRRGPEGGRGGPGPRSGPGGRADGRP